MVNNSMRCATEAAEKAAARVNSAALDNAHTLAADDAYNAASSTLPTAAVAAEEHGVSPRIKDDEGS
uniref:SMP domain-containing protein n=1 Tax=Peronospora matthiolae TaxID=2874970 RepID=A0AAV1U6R4_9STRA